MKEFSVKYHTKVKPYIGTSFINLKTFNFNGINTEGLVIYNAFSKPVIQVKPLPKRTIHREFELSYINAFGQLTTQVTNSINTFNIVKRLCMIQSNEIKPDKLIV